MFSGFKRALFRIFLQGYRFYWRIRGRSVVHFLHIGKTGGTAIKEVLRKDALMTRNVVVLHPHGIRLDDIPKGDKVVFFLRDPLSRFVSGFYSRQRQGRPRYDSPWSAAEAEAFGAFSSADELGCALSSPDSALRQKAEKAMREIAHVRDSYWTWFRESAYFLSRQQDVLFVGHQETLAQDFAWLAGVLGCRAELPAEDDKAHRNPEGVNRNLSETAKANLRSWYARDYEFIELCHRCPGGH